MTFEELGLSPEVLRAVAESGYETPTPIQETAIPYVLMGRDVMGVAQTGTGKTASFTLPMIDILASGRAKARMPRSLILEPTRELAAQVSENFEKYGRYTGLTHALLIGGESFKDQQALLERGVDVLIATPGRMLDLFERGNILLADTKLLVIDEADRKLDMGFIPDVERTVKLLQAIRQTLFFSATMAPEIRKLTDAFLMNPKVIKVAPPASPAKTVTQRLVRCGSEPKQKRAALRQLLDGAGDSLGSGLIFCNRKRDVGIVFRSLQRHGYDAAELHGDMAQPARMETLDRFKKGEVRLLVCSDVAARGLDIPKVSHVFNFDVPSNAEDYVHRIGRTGRAGRSGEAFTLVSRLDFKLLTAIEKLIGGKIEEVGSDAAKAEAAGSEQSAAQETVTQETAAQETVTQETGAAEDQRGGRRSGRRRGGRGRRRNGATETATPEVSASETSDTGQSGALNAAAQRSAEAGAERARQRRDAPPLAGSTADPVTDEAPQGRRPAARRRAEPRPEARPDTRPDTRSLPPEARDTAFGADVPAFLLKRVPLAANG